MSGEAAEALRRFTAGEPEAEPIRVESVRLDQPDEGAPGDDLARLLDALGRDPGEKLSISTLSPVFTSRLTTVAAAAVLVASDRDCWYGTGVLRPGLTAGRGYAEDVVGVRQLYADLDVKPGGLPSYADRAAWGEA